MPRKPNKKPPKRKSARKRPPAKAKPAARPEGDAYRRHRARAGEVQREKSRVGRDFGPLPPPANQKRRDACRDSFRLFCEHYFPNTFYLGWSDDHLMVIEAVERYVREGGLQSIAMPRGSGKSSLCEAACLWALLYRYRRFVALIGADEDHAREGLASMLSELENNDALLEDFPEVCLPIVELEGIRQRRLLCQGEPVKMRFAADEIQLPFIDGTNAQGGILRVAGITGRIRGMKAKLPDGASVRPDLVIVDDPQTDESAKSASQNASRERIVAGAILGLAGPGKKISGLMPCTVIQPGDMADRILDRKLHPEWNGIRTKLVYSLPTRSDLWDEYAQLRADGMRAGDGGKSATKFYRKNRKAMDEGAQPAWAERFNEDELSAVQNAMNLLGQDRAAFFAEYQNEPLDPDDNPSLTVLSHSDIAGKVNGLDRGKVMAGCQHLTAFIDVQGACLYWAVCGWKPDFTGQVVDYGTWPDQQRRYFSVNEVTRTLAKAMPRAGAEASTLNGLSKLSAELMGRTWEREDGADLRLNLVLVDANWRTAVVRDFCRRSQFGAAIMPAHGRGIGVRNRPMAEWSHKRGERRGMHWKTAIIERQQHLMVDVNFWKSFIYERLAVPFGDPASLTLFGAEADHRMIADHFLAERRTRATTDDGRTLDEWELLPTRPDNHWFDCVVGAAAAASAIGCVFRPAIAKPEGGIGKIKPKRKGRRGKVKYL